MFDNIGLEDGAAGAVMRENEFVIFAHVDIKVAIPEIEQIAFTSESQEQYEFLYPSGSFRIRKTNDDDYTLTGKKWVPNVPGKDEVNDPVSPAMFEVFKHVAESGLIKTRYKVYIPETTGTWPTDHPNYNDDGSLFWEIDVVKRHVDGELEPVEWLKVDLEVPGYDIDFRKFTLPFTYVEIFDKQFNERSPEEISWCKNLYTNLFNIKKNSISNTTVVTEELTASTEGFFDPIINAIKSIGQYYTDWQTERITSRPMPESERRTAHDAARKILKEVRKTYANKTWIASRTLVETDIDLSGLISHLYLGYRDYDPSLFNVYEQAVNFRKLVKDVEKVAVGLVDDHRRVFSRIQMMSMQSARVEIWQKSRDLNAIGKLVMPFNNKLNMPNQSVLQVVGTEIKLLPVNNPITINPIVKPLTTQNIHEVVNHLIDILEYSLDSIYHAINIRDLNWVISRNHDTYDYVRRVMKHWGMVDKQGQIYPDVTLTSKELTLIQFCKECNIDPTLISRNYWLTIAEYYSKNELLQLLQPFNTQKTVDNLVDGVGRVVVAFKQAAIVIEKYVHRSIVK
jgi:hypothetical protein